LIRGLGGKILMMAGLVLVLSLASSLPLHAGPKTDTVVLVNGDRITGEIKSLDRGRLRFSTDDMKTIYIDWVKIVRVESPNIFEIETEGFKRLFGSLTDSGEDSWIVISSGEVTYTQRIDRVVRITPLRGSFWRRLKILLDVGYSYTSFDNQQTFNLGSDISSRTEKTLRQLTLSTFMTSRSDEPSIARSLITFSNKRFFEKRPRLYTSWLGSAEQNDELGLDHRLTGGAGIGRNAIQNNLVLLGLNGGLVISQESFTGTTGGGLDWNRGEENASDDYNLDLYLGTDLSVARWHDPELDFTMTLVLFPSLTTTGRVRGRLDSRLRYEVFSDFFVGISGFMDYDNKPPVEGVEQFDFSAALTVGWAFNK